MPLTPIASLDDPRLQVYRSLKTTNLTRWSGLFIAEGKRVVERLVASDYPIESVLLSVRLVEEFAPLLPPDVPALVLPQPLAEELVSYNFHAGVLACGRRKPAPDLDAVLAGTRGRLTLIACPHTTDPDNLGTLIRLATAFGAAALLLGKGCADPYSRRTLRVSMGNAFQLPIIEDDELETTLVRLRNISGLEVVATVLGDDAEPLAAVTPSARTVLLFGNEADGLDRRWIDLTDRRVTIPMRPGTDSLNVAVAAGIFLYHFCRD